jgi:aerobic-type carbon monoxide dehydrogenase small subunit (CoxS/CutS family)
MLKDLELQVNGMKRRIRVDPARTLLSVLRDDLDLTGTKYGCGEAQCGACTVLTDGKAVRSCVLPVGRAVGKQITTIEGLEKDGRLHPLQEAFLQTDAMQCAYCTSGMIMSGVALLKEKPHPSRQQIIEYMDGNICRCGIYERIIAAIETAAGHSKGESK